MRTFIFVILLLFEFQMIGKSHREQEDRRGGTDFLRFLPSDTQRMDPHPIDTQPELSNQHVLII